MPIFEYKCRDCNNKFEKLVRSSDNEKPKCPKCESDVIVKVFSTFASSGDSKGVSHSKSSCGG